LQTMGLKKRFGKTQALDGVNLSVQAGEVYGFIGPNGAGKSTTIRVLLGIIKANEGSAQIFGKDVWRDAVSIHKKIAYVPGDVNLWSNLSGGEVIDLFCRLRKQHERSYRDELIQRFEFDPTKKCGTYSKGNRQKVALVAAFCTQADLYILDEPTSGLDPLMEQVFRQCVAKAKERGATVLLSSHILSEVEQLCDRISIIRAGKIIDSGTLAEMRHLTRNKVVVELASTTGTTKATDAINTADATKDTSATGTPFHTDGQFSGLENVSGVHELSVNGNRAEFTLDNSHTASMLAYFVEKNVAHMTSTPPTLEELFMGHYGDSANRMER
jgi:ABC-2 type transport system ATP-binding protein